MNSIYRFPRLSLIVAFGAAVLLGGGLTAGSAAQAGELKFASFVPPPHVLHRKVFAPMAAELAKVTGGKLTIRIYPSGALGKGPVEQYKRAATGVADIVFGLHGYTSPQFPRSLLIELPGVSGGPRDATNMMWNAFDQYLKGEYKRTKVLALWTNSSAVIITRGRPVRKPSDLQGLKIRVASAFAGRTIKAMGGTPVFMPVTKVYTALSTGVVDGVLIGASGITDFKLHEPGNYATVGLPPNVAAFYIVMNQGSWDKLPAEDKAALAKVSGRKLSLKAAEAFRAAGERGKKVFAEKNKTIITLTAAEAAAFRKVFDGVTAQVVSELEAKGTPAQAIIRAMKRGG